MRLPRIMVDRTDVMGMVAGLTFGIVSLIGFFLPWFDMPSNIEKVLLSGWDRFPLALYPWLVLAGSIMMVVFAACAIIVVVNNGSKAAKITLAWIAAIGSIMAFSASLLAMGGEDSQVAILYGLKLCAIFSFIGLMGFGIAFRRIIEPRQNRPKTISPSP